MGIFHSPRRYSCQGLSLSRLSSHRMAWPVKCIGPFSIFLNQGPKSQFISFVTVLISSARTKTLSLSSHPCVVYSVVEEEEKMQAISRRLGHYSSAHPSLKSIYPLCDQCTLSSLISSFGLLALLL